MSECVSVFMNKPGSVYQLGIEVSKHFENLMLHHTHKVSGELSELVSKFSE